MLTTFTKNVIKIIKNIPEGSVATYGQIALMAGQSKGARQVSRLLHSMSRKHKLPWHRVVNAKGKISLPLSDGYALQKALLESEGISFSTTGVINLDRYRWDGISMYAETDEGLM